jgi:multiple sugar transport system substrate-binding protein
LFIQRRKLDMISSASEISRRDALKWFGTGAVSLSLLSACGSTSSGKAAGEVTVWYYPFGPGIEQLFKGFAQEFQKEYPDVKIKLQLQPTDGRYPKLLTAFAAKQGPDVFAITTDALIRFASAKVIVPLDDLLPKSTWGAILPTATDEVAYQGSHWYLPTEHELPVWMYNPTLMENIGWDPKKPPATWDDMRKLCEQAKGKSLFGWGYNAASVTANDTLYPFLYQAGGRPLSADGKEATLNSAAGVEALTFIVELFNKGWSSKAYMNPIPTTEENPFFQKKQVISLQHKQNTLTTALKNFPDLHVGVTPVLKHKEQWGFGALRGWAISNKAKNKEAAAAWVSFLGRPAILQRYCESLGYMPVNKEAAANTFKDNAIFTALKSELPYTFGEQKHKYGRDIMPLIMPEIQAAIVGQKQPKQALDDAATKINALLAKG